MIKAAILICADLEDPRVVSQLRTGSPAVVFNPASVRSNTSTESSLYVTIVEGAKQAVELLLRGSSTFEKYRASLEDANNGRDAVAARHARGGIAHDAFVVRTDYP